MEKFVNPLVYFAEGHRVLRVPSSFRSSGIDHRSKLRVMMGPPTDNKRRRLKLFSDSWPLARRSEAELFFGKDVPRLPDPSSHVMNSAAFLVSKVRL